MGIAGAVGVDDQLFGHALEHEGGADDRGPVALAHRARGQRRGVAVGGAAHHQRPFRKAQRFRRSLRHMAHRRAGPHDLRQLLRVEPQRAQLVRPAVVDQVVAGLEGVGIVGRAVLAAEQARHIVRLMGEHGGLPVDFGPLAAKPQNPRQRKRRAEPQPQLLFMRAHGGVHDGRLRLRAGIVVHHAVGQRLIPAVQRHDGSAGAVDGDRPDPRRVHVPFAQLAHAVADGLLRRRPPVGRRLFVQSLRFGDVQRLKRHRLRRRHAAAPVRHRASHALRAHVNSHKVHI